MFESDFWGETDVEFSHGLGRKRTFDFVDFGASERPLCPGDLNRSMQYLDSKYREEDVADEVQIEDLLQRRTEEPDVGSLAGG